jgi:hypothetical protein
MREFAEIEQIRLVRWVVLRPDKHVFDGTSKASNAWRENSIMTSDPPQEGQTFQSGTLLSAALFRCLPLSSVWSRSR